MNLHLKQTILIFWTKFAQKGYFQSRAENRDHFAIEFSIFKLFWMPNLILSRQFWESRSNFPKKTIKKSFFFQIPHSKFLKLTWNSLTEKKYCQSILLSKNNFWKSRKVRIITHFNIPVAVYAASLHDTFIYTNVQISR